MSSEIRQADLKPCASCGEGVGHCGMQFFRLRIESFLIDRNAVMAQHGLELQLGGNAMLANVMGPDRPLAQRVADTGDVLVCQDCFLGTCGSLWENINDRENDE